MLYCYHKYVLFAFWDNHFSGPIRLRPEAGV